MCLGVVITALLGLAPAGTALLRAALLRAAALRRTAGLPLAALLRGRLPARRTSLRRHGSKDSGLRVRDNCNLSETTGDAPTRKTQPCITDPNHPAHPTMMRKTY